MLISNETKMSIVLNHYSQNFIDEEISFEKKYNKIMKHVHKKLAQLDKMYADRLTALHDAVFSVGLRLGSSAPYDPGAPPAQA